nr:uncharacterized protein LOC109750353 [Aegilops tauschii subsp. strangulata]
MHGRCGRRREAAAKKAEADKAAQADADAAAKAQADAAAKMQAEDAARRGTPLLVTPLRSAPPAPEFSAPNGGAGDEQPIKEREGSDAVLPEMEDYHNIRAASFNANIRELDRRTADLTESRKTNAVLQQQLGEANTALCAKEDECNKAAQERDRLAKELKDQAELHKAALKQEADNETKLLAGFDTERSGWAETRAALTFGYAEIEDIVDDFFPGNSVAANQAIEARREEQRAEGAEIATDAPRSLSEQLLSIQARLQPASRMLRRLQRAGAQAISALWPDMQAPLTPSRTADWLEVAAGRLELTTFRQEASAELVAVERDLQIRASVIAEYTNTGIFVPELNENGVEAPPEWFGLNPDDGEDSTEVIDSSDEGEGEEDEDDEDGAREVGADGQPQHDRASSNKPRASTPTIAENRQAKTRQPTTPPAGAPDSTNLPDSPAAPLV